MNTKTELTNQVQTQTQAQAQTQTHSDYSSLSDKEIVELDLELFKSYKKFWKKFDNLYNFHDIPEIPQSKIHCMIPGDIFTTNNGRFLLQKTTGGMLKHILQDPTNYEINRIRINQKYRQFMIIHRLDTPIFYNFVDKEFYVYMKSYEKDRMPEIIYDRECVGGIQYINNTRNIWKECIEHHEYMMVFHNEKQDVIFSETARELIQNIIKTAEIHDIETTKPKPPQMIQIPILQNSLYDRHDERFYCYIKCIFFVNIVCLLVALYATMIFV